MLVLANHEISEGEEMTIYTIGTLLYVGLCTRGTYYFRLFYLYNYSIASHMRKGLY